ncbi:MAG: PEP-CTERM sorting domain-containing protein [Pirellulales bacterium]
MKTGLVLLFALTIGATPLLAQTSTVDITDNALVLDYTEPEPNPAATIRSYIITGRGTTGFGATWTGTGITSSTAAADVIANPESTSVAYAHNGSLPLGPYANFVGRAVDDSSVLIRYTRTGDANLDGLVNDDDVTILGATYAPGVPQPSWALGDFDYNGFVDDDDATLLGVFYNPNATPISAPTATGGVAAVPEPATWLMLVIGGSWIGMFGWRRR